MWWKINSAEWHRRLKCPKCGYENDRDTTACLNMLRMRGAQLPLKAINDAPEAGMKKMQ
jgi:transposase